MGVPKFYRWISERYPCLSEVVKEYQVPEFDNLYLDMNGIIHVCSHPNDDDPHFRITEEQIFKDIFRYIEVLFRIVCPREVFFMAVDGVAPRAKMNQQRGRRFRSAKEADENIKKALAKGEMLPEEKRFDSNCITPGTKFMVRLQEQLEYMVKSKVTTDPAWQGIRIYLSGHETPGEGEHKIMEFIRNERMKKDYNANTRHCLYGLDADLMMLGLCSHEPHFSLLREEVRFTGKKKHAARTAKPEETTFHLLHLSLMREYIDHEFSVVKNDILLEVAIVKHPNASWSRSKKLGRLNKKNLPFEYDLEAIIDDWVLMGFLVGNDFIPHLPNLHINHNALPLLYQTYMEVLPTLDGYLNEGGLVNLNRFGRYLQHLSKFDMEKFEEVFADFKWLESKTGKKKGKARHGLPRDVRKLKGANESDSFGSLEEDSNLSEAERNPEQKSIRVITDLSIKQGLTNPDSDTPDEEDDKSTYRAEFKLYKRNYYQEKLHFEGTEGEVGKIAYEYVLAIQWICHYYYNGVQSWSWYYPYHYAPFLSDIRNVGRMKLTYDMAKPFLPYEQLLAVLPAGSKECLPEPFWDLMSSSASPIIDYYPTDFTCDLNGKQQEWEAVVLIPFINEERLLSAMVPCIKALSKPDKERNKHSGCHLYTFDGDRDFYVKSSLTGTFPNIAHCKARLEVIPLHAWSSTRVSDFVKGLLPGCRLSVYYPGFPTFYHLPHRCALQKRGVKVFQMPSRNENMIVSMTPPTGTADSVGQPYSEDDTIEDIANRLLGTSIYINWPHMEEAKVVAVSDGDVKFEVSEHVHASGNKGSKHKTHKRMLTPKEFDAFRLEIEGVTELNLERRGIEVGETKFIAYAQTMLGRKYVCSVQGQITLEKQWASHARPYPLQAAVKDIAVKDPNFQSFKDMNELFPVGSIVFMLGNPYYGCQGKVTGVQNGMTSLELMTPCEPDIESVIRQRHALSSRYFHSWELGSRIGISNYLLSRITGTIFVFFPANRKWQIGLNLRFTKESSGIAGYTKNINKEWLYSEAVEGVLAQYMEKFPTVLRYLQSALHRNEDQFDAIEMTRAEDQDDAVEKLKGLTAWLKSLPCYHGDKVNQYSDMLEPAVVERVLQKVDESRRKKPPKAVPITMRPHLLYRPLAHQGTLIPDKTARHQLLDRIVNVRDSYTVPLGLRGTIVGIHRQPGQDVLHDVVFDEEFLGGLELGGRCPKRRGYRMPDCAMVNISHGSRASGKDGKPTAIVKPQNTVQAWGYNREDAQFRANSPRRMGGALAHSRVDNRKQQPVRSQTWRSQHSGPTSIMQRPNSSTVQPDQRSNRPKTSDYSSKSPANNMFDALWNSLKEENTKNAAERPKQHKEKRPTATKKQQKSVPIITPPTFQPSGESRQKDAPLKADKVSLAQAAMSLPKMNLPGEGATDKFSKGKIDQSSTHQQATRPTTTVTQANSATSENKDAEHLENLFKSIKVTRSGESAFSPKLAFTPTQVLHHTYAQDTSRQRGPPLPSNPMSYRQPFPGRNFQAQPRFQNRNMPPFMMRPPYYPSVQQFVHQNTVASRQHGIVQREGTQKLCEMLKHEEDDNNSSKWSAGEEAEDAPDDIDAKNSEEKENPSAQELTDKIDKLTVKRESDADSEKEEQDEYMERSTSVEDQSSNIIKKQTNVEELQSLCIKCKMMSPIYTYFTTDDEQVVSTVQLWSGVRFSSRPHRSRDKAMEAAAYQGLAYLKYELKENRPISTSPPSSAYVTVHNVAPNQYYAPHPAFATPMSYATSPHAYYYPGTPYHVMPTRTVGRPDISPAAVIHPSYTVGPGHHVGMPPYQPFMQYPYLPVQVSPTHHSKRMPQYASRQPRTEFKILDKPPVPKETKEQSDQCDATNSVDDKATTAGDQKDIENKNKRSKPQRQQSQTKPKLAVSFTQAKE